MPSGDYETITVKGDLRDRLIAAKRGNDTYTDVIERYFDISDEELRLGGYEPPEES